MTLTDGRAAGADVGHGPALVVHAPGDVRLEQRSVRSPGATEVLVTPAHVGVCGTDLEIVDGKMDPAYVTYPLVLGHEWSGRVAAVGDQVTRVRAGDPVVVEGIIPDGVCDACRRGDTNLCETYDELGFVRDGAAGPGVTVPQHLVHRLGSQVPLYAGALVEPSAVVLRGLSVMDIRPGMDVLVIGDGTVGLLAARLASLWSPARVTVAGRRSEQASLAEALGADEFTVDSLGDRSFDLVVEAAGAPEAVGAAFAATRRGGQTLLLGIAGHGRTLPLGTDDIVNNDLRIRGSFGYTAATWARTTQLLNAGVFDPTPLVTHRFALSDFRPALEALAGPVQGPRGKVMFDLDAPSPAAPDGGRR